LGRGAHYYLGNRVGGLGLPRLEIRGAMSEGNWHKPRTPMGSKNPRLTRRGHNLAQIRGVMGQGTRVSLF